MIFNLPKWWSSLTYDGFKSHVNVTYSLKILSEERIKFGKEESGTSAFNRAYDKLLAKQDKAQKSQLLELERQKVRVWINQWQLIMIISTATQKIPSKFWTDSFVAVNPHPRHHLSISGWIKNIAPAVKTGETEYFRNYTGYYYDAMPSIWRNIAVIKIREVMYVIDHFTTDTHHGKYPWTKKIYLIYFVPLDQIPKIKICRMVASEHPEVIEGRRQMIAMCVLYSEE